jgi:putative Ca2+/H+ antiporter (TMEM165/GDT1 family)
VEAFFVSVLVIAVGEIGDKTQLLALMLAARFKKPIPIVAGILVATLFNHTLAGLAGAWIRSAISITHLRWIVAGSFFAIALWALKPDAFESNRIRAYDRYGAFAVTTVAFFVAEIGDKTQVATVALAARFGNLVAVVAGTTLGMLIADLPAVLLGQAIASRVSFRVLRGFAAGLFALLGVVTLLAPGID